MSKGPRIALIHALEESVAPARSAFRRDWPSANVFDLLDTSLSRDLAARGTLDDELANRFIRLADYAASSTGEGGDTAAILFTCSAFGTAIEAVKQRLHIPVLTPNEAAFEDAVRRHETIGLIVSFEPSERPLCRELADCATKNSHNVSVVSAVAEGALEALKRGDTAGHDNFVSCAAEKLGPVDVLLLGQFSLARSASALEERQSAPVLTTPASAVHKLKGLLGAL
ncbi:MAG: aspartate/glutamate racemase family protein [Pseudomonadota bacterium]